MISKIKHNKLFVFTLLLTVYVFVIISVVEILNFRLGGILPYEYDGHGGWRYVLADVSKYECYLERIVRHELGLSEYEPLPQDKQKQIHEKALRNANKDRLENALHETIEVYGIQLYLLCPFVFLLSIANIFRRRTRCKTVGGVVCLMMSIFYFCLVILRDYVGSLGW